MDLALVIGIVFIIGCGCGAIGVHYIHNVASAATRAVTVPSGSTASVGTVVGGVAKDLQDRIAALEAKLSTAAPKA